MRANVSVLKIARRIALYSSPSHGGLNEIISPGSFSRLQEMEGGKEGRGRDSSNRIVGWVVRKIQQSVDI